MRFPCVTTKNRKKQAIGKRPWICQIPTFPSFFLALPQSKKPNQNDTKPWKFLLSQIPKPCPTNQPTNQHEPALTRLAHRVYWKEKRKKKKRDYRIRDIIHPPLSTRPLAHTQPNPAAPRKRAIRGAVFSPLLVLGMEEKGD